MKLFKGRPLGLQSNNRKEIIGELKITDNGLYLIREQGNESYGFVVVEKESVKELSKQNTQSKSNTNRRDKHGEN